MKKILLSKLEDVTGRCLGEINATFYTGHWEALKTWLHVSPYGIKTIIWADTLFEANIELEILQMSRPACAA
jgi:hypothetical protein